MKLAFNGEAHYPDFNRGYELYTRTSRGRECVSREEYARIVRMFCKVIADRLCEDGMVDLPCNIGTLAASMMTRKPIYRNGKFIGYGKMDWNTGNYDGNINAFGVVFLPDRRTNENLRSYGFVANRRLFKKVKDTFTSDDCEWVPMDFNDEII